MGIRWKLGHAGKTERPSAHRTGVSGQLQDVRITTQMLFLFLHPQFFCESFRQKSSPADVASFAFHSDWSIDQTPDPTTR